jgi:hypothetical protein
MSDGEYKELPSPWRTKDAQVWVAQYRERVDAARAMLPVELLEEYLAGIEK